MKHLLRIHLPLFGANLIYGGNYTVAKEVVPAYIGPFGMIVIRVTVATLLFWLFHAFMTRERIRSARDYLHLVACAFFGVAVNQLMFFKGLSITTPINASLIMTLTPVLVLLLSHMIVREPLSLSKWAGILCGAAGAAMLLLLGSDLSFGSDTAAGDVCILINAASYGLYLVLVKPLMIRYHPLTVIKWVFFFGIFFVVPVGYGEFSAIQWDAFTPAIWTGLSYVVVLTTFMAYLLNAVALSSANPSVVGIYIYLQPVLAALIAILAGKDELTLTKILFSVLIFIGVFLVGKKQDMIVESPDAAKPVRM